MESPASEIARRLGENAEAVCRGYLSNGRREGRYWLVGDIHNSPGRSLYVLLAANGEGHGRAGKWTDAQTGDHGDLLDVIAASCGHGRLRDTLDEARRFLSLPEIGFAPRNPRPSRSAAGSIEAARRLLLASRAIGGTTAATYLASRGIKSSRGLEALRFHPRCFYRPSREDGPGCPAAFPALIAAVTANDGAVMGVQRGWLDPSGLAKAPVACPRRAMGALLGHGVRFGRAAETMAAGEGIETMLSVREVLPSLPLIAGLSGAHLAAIAFPEPLRRLYVACDRDAAGAAALATLEQRGDDAGLEVIALMPVRDDFNSDLREDGPAGVMRSLRGQMGRSDWKRLAA